MSQVWPTSWYGMSGPGSHGSNLDVTRPSPGILCVSYPCYSMACLDRQGLEFGDKIILPEAAFNKAHSLRLRLPLLFKVVNAKKGVDTNGPSPYLFCGVLEFSAPRDQVFVPYWMMQKLLLTEGERVELQSIGRPPPGSFVRFRPQDDEFLVLAAQQGPKALMESALRHYSVLSERTSILVQHEGNNFHLDVVEIKTQAAPIPTEEIDHGSIERDGGQRRRRENSKRLVRSENRVGYDEYDENVDGYSSSTVNGGRRVSLVSLLGDIDLEVEFCPRGVDSSEAEGLRREATGALVQDFRALTSSRVSGCATDVTKGMKRGKLSASELALPPPASATKITNCSNVSRRIRVPGGRLPTVTPLLSLGNPLGSLRSGPGKDVSSSAVSKRRSSRCRAFSGKGVSLGSTTYEVDSETAAEGDQDSLDHQLGLREYGMSIAVAGDEFARLEGGEAALDMGRNGFMVTASRGNLKASSSRIYFPCVARPDEAASPEITKAAARNPEGAEQAAIFKLNGETDVYVCQRCGRCVPTANRTLHELRCFTVLGTKDLHPPSSSLRLQETWPMCPEKTKQRVTPGTEGKWKVGKITPEDCSSSRQAEDLADGGKRDSITSCKAEGFLGNGVQILETACVSGAAVDRCSVEAPERKTVSEECSFVATSGKSTPSKESIKNGEVVPGHGVEGAIFPTQHGDHQNATVSTPQPTCSFCGLSFRMPGAAAAHEMFCGARTERCPTCGGYVPRREMESHRKPGGSCDAMIAATMATEEEAAVFFFSDSNIAACVDYGSGGGDDLRRCLYSMPKLNASPADTECSSNATSIRDRRDFSVLGAQSRQHQRRGIPSALGDSIPMATRAIRADGQSFVDANADAATDGGTTITTLESEGGGCGRNHGHPTRPHISDRSVDVDETEAITKDEQATIGVSTMTRIESRDGHFSEETLTLVNGGSRPTASEVKLTREEVDATFQDGRNGHRCTRSGGVPVLPSRTPVAGDAAAFVEEQIIGVDNRRGVGVPLTGEVMGTGKNSWACSQCTLLNSLYADACDACGAIKMNSRDVDAEGAVTLKTPRETRRCDAPTTEVPAEEPGRNPNGQPSGSFVHSEAPPNRSITGACGALHRQHANQLQHRRVVVAAEGKYLLQQDRDDNRRQGQPTSINTFRSTMASSKTGRWGLGGNHRLSTLRHLPPVIRPRHTTDGGTPLFLSNDAIVGITSVSADLSDVTVSSRFPSLKSSGTRKESWTGRQQQKQPNASNIPKKPYHFINRARSSCSTNKNSKGSGRALTTAPASADSKTTACDQFLSIVGNRQVISCSAFVGSASRKGTGRSQPLKPTETSSPLARDFQNSGLGTEGLEAQQRGRGHTGLALAKLRRRRVSHAGMVLEPLGSK